jgi:hypothetical protein
MRKINAWLLAVALMIGLAQVIWEDASSQGQDPGAQQQPAEAHGEGDAGCPG